MPLALSSEVTQIRGIGPAKAEQLERLGITHVRDFLYTFPRRYDDLSRRVPIARLKPGERATVHGRITRLDSEWGWRGRTRVLRIHADITDDTGTILAIWYNMRFLLGQLKEGREIALAGTIELNQSKEKTPSERLQPTTYNLQPRFRFRSPIFEFLDRPNSDTHTGRIAPVYPETYGVTSRFLRYHVQQLLPLIQAVPEYLPDDIRQRQKLIGIHDAIRAIHFPEDQEEIEQAKKRLRFDELFFLQLAGLVRRRQRGFKAAIPLPPAKAVGQFIKKLPFKLTGAQQAALDEVLADLARPRPMNRLIQGDVGSGKSIIAAAASHHAITSGHAVLYLAPTEVLARQQAELFRNLLGPDFVELLVGSLTARAKNRIKQRLTTDEPCCVVGTHALLQDDVVSRNCALVIVDEQHRFGVAQRHALQSQHAVDTTPHLLSMTATPIPRTLNLTVYGDLDVSLIRELPAGRRPVITRVTAKKDRDDVIVHVLEELHQGRQAYVIAPLIEARDKTPPDVRSAKATYEGMQHLFPGIAVGLLHGQLPAAEKEGVLKQFAAGAIQLLVATSVVEVGVNVPAASVMIIEGAERFGLAQLHQFRGRIGRGTEQSYCYLFPSSDTALTNPRLTTLATTTDGFVIAEEDLKLRGPGELYGVAQSGFGNLQVASLLDYDAIKKARAEAEQLLEKDPDLKTHSILRRKVEQKNAITHWE